MRISYRAPFNEITAAIYWVFLEKTISTGKLSLDSVGVEKITAGRQTKMITAESEGTSHHIQAMEGWSTAKSGTVPGGWVVIARDAAGRELSAKSSSEDALAWVRKNALQKIGAVAPPK